MTSPLSTAALLGVLLAAWPAYAQVSDEFSSSSEYDDFAVGGARRWYDQHSTDAREKSSHCLAILEEAKTYQDTALALYEEARQPGNSRRSSELVRQANEQIALRTETLRAFTDCVNQGIRAANADRISSANDETPDDQPQTPARTPVLQGHIYYEEYQCGPVPQGADPEIPAAMQQRLMNAADDLRGHADQMIVDGSAATGEFLHGMADWASDTAAFMAQRPGVPAEQIAEAATEYLLNDNASNHRRLYQAAAQAFDELKQNPAYFCGKALPDLVPLPGPGKFKKLVMAERLEESAKRLGKIFQGKANLPVCVSQQDCFWKSMVNATGDPSYLSKTHAASRQEIIDELKRKFGGANAKDPLTGAAEHQASLAEGIPIPVDVGEFVDILNKAPDGFEALMFVQSGPNGTGHVATVSKLKGELFYWDNQMKTSNLDIITAGHTELFLYRYQ